MEIVADKVRAELELMTQTNRDDGGIADVLPIKAIYFGDPGIIPASLYPCITVSPESASPVNETTGYDLRELKLFISVLIDARQFFDQNVDEAMGDRILVQATELISGWFRRKSNRTLDSTVLNLSVGDTVYRQQERGSVVTKVSRTSFFVRKTYARVQD